jgi:hypothetical protein
MYKVWYQETDKNFGDMLTPYVLNHFGIKHRSVKHPNQAEMVAIGSIIKTVARNQIVLGSGIMRFDDHIEPSAKYRFVRGPLTRQEILKRGGTCPEIYGDLGLLLPLICPEQEKQYKVGIVPHFVDYKHVKQKYGDYKVIDVKNSNPLEVAKEISKCEYIISSSLHGIIAAHAYGIPAAWVKFSNKVKGGNVKFDDYYASINIPGHASTVESPVYQLGSLDTQPLINILEEYRNNK